LRPVGVCQVTDDNRVGDVGHGLVEHISSGGVDQYFFESRLTGNQSGDSASVTDVVSGSRNVATVLRSDDQFSRPRLIIACIE